MSSRSAGTRWVARLKPTPESSIDALLEAHWGLDVWECRTDEMVVAASEAQLSELERRHLAEVTRLSTVDEYQARARRGGQRETQRG